MRVIDADNLKKVMWKILEWKLSMNIPEGQKRLLRLVFSWFMGGIDDAPAITHEELVPHGRWILHDDELFGLSCECSVCHIETCGDTPYCPHCGAKMCVK